MCVIPLWSIMFAEFIVITMAGFCLLSQSALLNPVATKHENLQRLQTGGCAWSRILCVAFGLRPDYLSCRSGGEAHKTLDSANTGRHIQHKISNTPGPKWRIYNCTTATSGLHKQENLSPKEDLYGKLKNRQQRYYFKSYKRYLRQAILATETWEHNAH